FLFSCHMQRLFICAALILSICHACSCMSVENVLYVNCEKVTVYRPTQLIPPASSLYHLNFQNNFLIILYPNSFLNFTHAVSLQLGNNKLQNIEGGAFMGMSALKQLHLNNNELKVLRADTFQGIENLEYLQADYNLIKYIEKGAFNKLHRLKVLILNDNLIQALPDNIFRFASLTHLDIRGNRIQKIPYLGVLEHIGRIVELQLDDNPWNCTCDLAPLKAWLENMPYNIFIGEAICETPSDLYGRLLKETNKQELCPMGTGSDFDVRMPPPDNGQSPSKMSPTSIYGNGIVAGLPPFGRNSQIISVQTRPPPMLCPQPCSCKAHPSDFGISVSCQERNIQNLADLLPKPPNAKKLHMSGNYIRDISPVDFQGFEGLDLLHLGSNQIVTVQKGVFSNLTNLRRLYLNGNQLEQLHPEMFLGLTNLQYLYLEYNAIKEILAGTFDSMPNLQLLYLNNNVLRSLPAYTFAGVSLARLNLKNNHFMTLPVSGVLDQLRSLTQIDLEGNPWECSCDLVALKLWLEKLSDGVAAKEVKCASPVQFSNIELRLLKNEILCPKLVARPPFILTAATPVLTTVLPTGVGKAPPGGPVPLSIMILSILVVLIFTVFVAFCLLVFVLRRNKKPVGRQEVLGNQECGSMSLQVGDSMDATIFYSRGYVFVLGNALWSQRQTLCHLVWITHQ
uniref:SLIT and NTRK like family member 4 n=1 Tax=Cyclopterus lumpus TaxID=8103 RepID=A0A8C2ZT08_CYCLU